MREEIGEYKYIDIIQYEKEILPKAQELIKTKMAKSMKAQSRAYSDQPLINLNDIICIILYTDYTKLCTNFSASFRKINTFEPMHSIKQRHRNYYYLSKILRETVHKYGKAYQQGFRGPFYCGMSMVMTMPEFAIKLMSPTSTSAQIAVSMKFSGDKGIIIGFNNPPSGYTAYTMGMDFSCFSRFKEEDERCV